MFQHLKMKSMFVALHSDINSFKSGLLHLTVQPYCKKGRLAKVKDGIISFILRNYLIDQYISLYENKPKLVLKVVLIVTLLYFALQQQMA